MPLPIPSPRRIALLGLLLASLVVLADGVVRIELSHAVSATASEGARAVAYVATADD